MEYLVVEPAEDGLTRWIMLGSLSKGPKEGRPFRLALLTDAEARFERKSGDFPSTITYRRLGLEAMFCRLEGTRNGQPAHEDYDFKRVSLLSPTAR